MESPRNLGHEVGLLRHVVENLDVKPIPFGPFTEETLRAAGLARGKLGPGGLAGVAGPGIEALTQLCEISFNRSPKVSRGTSFANYDAEFFQQLLTNFVGRDANSISTNDVQTLEGELFTWFEARAATRTVFVPCMLSPRRSPRFATGPVSFLFIDDIPTSEFYPRNSPEAELEAWPFKKMLETMRNERAHWLAAVELDGCDQDRASEVGDIAVDLAIVAVQLAAPNLGTKNMSRLATRRGLASESTLTLINGHYSSSWTLKEPGSSMGDGLLGEIVTQTARIFAAVGNCVRSFVTGNYRLPKLEQAWCDAAYWLQQGLVEPLDTIAVAKLETAIEVLLIAENMTGSQSRMMAALETFYGLKPDDRVQLYAQVTARQYAKRFVEDRSRVLHGTRSTLNSKLHASRDQLEHFAMTLVRSYALELDEYSQSTSSQDDSEAFLAWVKWRRQQPDRQRRE